MFTGMHLNSCTVRVGLSYTQKQFYLGNSRCHQWSVRQGSVENRRTVRFRFSNNQTEPPVIQHSIGSFIRHVGIPSRTNSVLWLPHVSIISLYCTLALGPVKSVAFILTPIFFLLRPTCNSALNAKHYYVFASIWPVTAAVMTSSGRYV